MNDPGTAFVTGGSGFIGGALVRRLKAGGHAVRGLCRSDRSAAAVEEAGAEPVRGDLGDVDAMVAGMAGCRLVFHVAGETRQYAPREAYEAANVEGTGNVVEAARQAGVARLVHVGTEAALMAGQPLVDVDENAALQLDSPVPYCSSKARAERAVLRANREDLETVVVRPCLVWGPGDATLLPALVESVRSGSFRWIDGGRSRHSTTHVDNAVEGLILAGERGTPGRAYFVSDGEPIVFRDFVTRLLATQGIEAPDRRVPLAAAKTAAAATEGVWRLLRRADSPPLTRMAVWVTGMEVTVDITRARTELGYRPVRSIDDGLEELAASTPAG